MSYIICYHYACTDGVFASLAAQLAKKEFKITTVPHSTSVRLDLTYLRSQVKDEDATLMLLDYSGPDAAFILQACSLFKIVILIDHHKTCFEIIRNPENVWPSNLIIFMDNDHSGCILTQRYFGVTLKPSLQRVFEYVEDNDIWAHKLPNSKEFTAGFRSLNLELDFNKNPELFNRLFHLTAEECIELGKVELQIQARLISQRLESRVWVSLGGFKVLATHLEATDSGITSQLGHELSVLNTECGVGAVISDLEDGERVHISLRGKDKTVDTTLISKQFPGGGGHAGASGFDMKLDDLDSKIIHL